MKKLLQGKQRPWWWAYLGRPMRSGSMTNWACVSTRGCCLGEAPIYHIFVNSESSKSQILCFSVHCPLPGHSISVLLPVVETLGKLRVAWSRARVQTGEDWRDVSPWFWFFLMLNTHRIWLSNDFCYRCLIIWMKPKLSISTLFDLPKNHINWYSEVFSGFHFLEKKISQVAKHIIDLNYKTLPLKTWNSLLDIKIPRVEISHDLRAVVMSMKPMHH